MHYYYTQLEREGRNGGGRRKEGEREGGGKEGGRKRERGERGLEKNEERKTAPSMSIVLLGSQRYSFHFPSVSTFSPLLTSDLRKAVGTKHLTSHLFF